MRPPVCPCHQDEVKQEDGFEDEEEHHEDLDVVLKVLLACS